MIYKAEMQVVEGLARFLSQPVERDCEGVANLDW